MARLPNRKTVQPKARARFTEQYGIMMEMLIELRLKSGITQADMGRQLGKSQSHVSMWERRESEMSVIDVLNWCQVVGVGAGKFFDLFERRVTALSKKH